MKRLYSLLKVLSLIILLCLSKSVVNGYERISKSLSVIPDLNSVSKKAVINEYETISNENIASPVIGATSYDWKRKRIKPDTSYKGTIEIENLSASPITIISADGRNSNFVIDLNQFTNLKLQPGQKKTFTVEFKPISIGEKNLTINYITNIAGVTAQSVLNGIGIIGQLRTTDIDFDTTIVGTVKPKSRQLTIECIKSAFEDSVTIKDLVVTSGSINPELTVFSADGFRYDKAQLKLQKTLKPGERIIVNCEFLAPSLGMYSASLTTVSDAEKEVTSLWTGFGVGPFVSSSRFNATGGSVENVVVGSEGIISSTITNTGNNAFLIDSIALEPSPQFTIIEPKNPEFSFALIKAIPFVVKIKYKPTSSGTTKTQLHIYSVEAKDTIVDIIGSATNISTVSSDVIDSRYLNILKFNPNPVRDDEADVSFSIRMSGEINLAIYDNSGTKVGFLSLGTIDAGSYTVKAPIEGLSSGTYMLRLSSGPYKQEQQIVIVK